MLALASQDAEVVERVAVDEEEVDVGAEPCSA